MIDYCMLRLKQISEYEVYRIYITDGLKAISDIMSKGSVMPKRFADFINNKANVENTEENIDNERKGQEIKTHMKNLLGKLGKEGG